MSKVMKSIAVTFAAGTLTMASLILGAIIGRRDSGVTDGSDANSKRARQLMPKSYATEGK